MTPAQAIIAAMITPALLILASASLVATVLVRLARVVDRSRVLIAGAHDAPDRAVLRATLDRHRQRAIYAERSVALFFAAVVVFVLDCLTIGIDRLAGDSLTWLPVAMTMLGMGVLIAGAAYMLVESQLGADQILDEIDRGRALLRD